MSRWRGLPAILPSDLLSGNRVPAACRVGDQLAATRRIERGIRPRATHPFGERPQDDPGDGKFRSLPLAGYGSRRGKPATGVHDDLYVKAVALRVGDRVGVMVGADALIIPAEVTDLAMRRISRSAA